MVAGITEGGNVMSDRELLECAARAAGIGYDQYVDGFAPELFHYGTASGLLKVDSEMLSSTCWNPLHDDGDALRLAVQSDLTFQSLAENKTIEAWHHGYLCWEPWGHDKFAATRRAIVRAAAEIGKKVDAPRTAG